MVSFDASAAALGYKAPALVMHGCIHLIQPSQSHFYSTVFEKVANQRRAVGCSFNKDWSALDLIPHGIFRQAPE